MNKLISVILLMTALLPALVIGSGQDSPGQKRSGFLTLPILFYTPETKLAGGAAINYYFRESGSASTSRPSTIMPSITYTQQNQIMAELVADLYWQNEMYHILGYLGYKKFPDKFYGIGKSTPKSNEESYTPRSAKINLSILKRIGANWSAGVQYEFEHNKLIQVEESGLLAQGDIVGSEAGMTSGAGFLLNRDSRDNIFYPTSGNYCQFLVTLFNSALGSDYDFKRYNLDFRQYLSLSYSQVVAVQSYLNMQTGEPPFQKLAMLAGRIGGYNLMRGY